MTVENYKTGRQLIREAAILASHAGQIFNEDSLLIGDAYNLVERSYGKLIVLPGDSINIPMDAMVRLRAIIEEFKVGKADKARVGGCFKEYEDSIQRFKAEIFRATGKSLDDSV